MNVNLISFEKLDKARGGGSDKVDKFRFCNIYAPFEAFGIFNYMFGSSKPISSHTTKNKSKMDQGKKLQ